MKVLSENDPVLRLQGTAFSAGTEGTLARKLAMNPRFIVAHHLIDDRGKVEAPRRTFVPRTIEPEHRLGVSGENNLLVVRLRFRVRFFEGHEQDDPAQTGIQLGHRDMRPAPVIPSRIGTAFPGHVGFLYVASGQGIHAGTRAQLVIAQRWQRRQLPFGLQSLYHALRTGKPRISLGAVSATMSILEVNSNAYDLPGRPGGVKDWGETPRLSD